MKNKLKIVIFLLIVVTMLGCRKESKQEETKETKETQEMQETNETLDVTEITDETEDEEESTVAEETTEETQDEQETIAEGGGKAPSGKVFGKASDYLPLVDNTRYHYEGEGNEYATFDVYVDYVTKDTIQLRTNNGGSEIVQVFKKNSDNITRNLFRGEVYYRENLTSKEDADKDIILKDPIQVGNSWTLSDGSKSEITGIEVKIETSLGTYHTVEVTTTTDQGKVKEYFAKDIGLVKLVYLDDDTTITSTLSKIDKNQALVQTIRFFYPDKNMENIIYHDKEVTFKTNDISKMMLERAYKNIEKDNASPVIPEKANILSLYLNKDGAVYIDFSKELVTQMNAGSGGENLILQSIVNTFGNYYGVEKVYLTVDNKPYESGHIVLEKGEKLKVDMEKVID